MRRYIVLASVVMPIDPSGAVGARSIVPVHHTATTGERTIPHHTSAFIAMRWARDQAPSQGERSAGAQVQPGRARAKAAVRWAR